MVHKSYSSGFGSFPNKINNKKHKCTGWSIVATMERPDGTWYADTITDIDDDTASSVDTFLTEYCEDKIINETVPHNDIKEANKNE